MEWNAEAYDIFGRACLMVNDLIGPSESDVEAEDSSLGAYSIFLPLTEFAVDRHFFDIIGRAVQLWLHIPQEPNIKNAKNSIDFDAVFFDAYGVHLEVFLKIIYVIFSRCSNIKPMEKDVHTRFAIEPEKGFHGLDFTEAEITNAIKVLSCPLKEIGDRLYEHHTVSKRYDFTALQCYPLIEVEDGVHVVYDKDFLLKFATHGIWWRIEDALPEEQKDRFKSFFGEIFEVYIGRLMKHTYDNLSGLFDHKLLANPMFDSSTEVCDALVNAEDNWVVIEAKGVLLTTRAKYANDLPALKRELDTKFIATPRGDRKAVKQLANSIKKLIDGAKPVRGELNITRCRGIYPVIIAYDTAVCGKYLASYLNETLKKELGTLPKTAPVVFPLTVMSVTDAEAFSTVGRRLQLPHLLASYRMYTMPNELFKNHIISDKWDSVRVEESYSAVNYRLLHDATVRSFLEGLPEIKSSASDS
jgi:hypothetical protein